MKFELHALLILGVVKKYFHIRSVLCNKPLCASGENNSDIVICDTGSGYVWFQSLDNTTIRWKNDERLGFSALYKKFTLTTFSGDKRQFWRIDEDEDLIANRKDFNEVVDLKDSNCSNGAVIFRQAHNASAENQKWNFVYVD